MQRRRFRRESGFILVWGHRTLSGNDGSMPVAADCPLCRQQSIFHGRQHRRWFTFFFIPVFPIGAPHRYSECTTCGQTVNRTVEQIASGTAFTPQPSAFAPREGPAGDNLNAVTMRLHHEMLADPENSPRLLQLMRLYVQMGEPSDARAAARAFPIACANEPACGALLANIG